MLIEYPNLTGGTPDEALAQVQSYLCQLADKLSFAVSDLDRQIAAAENTATGARSAALAVKESPRQTFSKVKDLIIKSADIVDAYYEQINLRLSGMYVASSDFGNFQQQTISDISASSEKIEQNYQNLQIISEAQDAAGQLLDSTAKSLADMNTVLQGLNAAMIEVNAYIRTGLLYYTEEAIPVYGVEIGQQNTVQGVVEFQKFARLTADRLSFFDSNDIEVAYIGDYQMVITNADVGALRAKTVASSHFDIGDYILQVSQDGHLTLS